VVAFLFWKSIEQKIWPIKKEFSRLKKQAEWPSPLVGEGAR
jgi:hypothetical protein